MTINYNKELGAFTLIHLSIKYDLFDSLFSALLNSLSHISKFNWDQRVYSSGSAYEITRDVGTDLRVELIKGVDWDNGEGEELISKYLEEVKSEYPEYMEGAEVDEFANGVWEIIGGYDYTLKPTDDDLSACYLLQQRLIGATISDLRIALAPFLYIIQLPFWPPIRANELAPTVRTILKGDDPISLSKVQLELTKMDLAVTEEYLHFSLINDPNVFLVHDKILKVDLCEEIFPSFELATVGLNSSDYARVKKAFGWEKDVGDIELFPNELLNFFRTRGETRFIDLVDPEEVTIKTYIRSDAPMNQRQGLPDLVHAEIVNALKTEKQALRLSDLQRLTGLHGLNLLPERLPPGRILSYAPSQRFLNRDLAYYVLHDWVESPSKTKGKIIKDRIVTPLYVKNFELNGHLVETTVSCDPTYNEYGLVNAESLARIIAYQLPDKPTELYYVRIIQDYVEDWLSRKCENIGKAYYLDNSIGFSRPQDISAAKWRRIVLDKLLNHPVDIREAIEVLPPEHKVSFFGLM